MEIKRKKRGAFLTILLLLFMGVIILFGSILIYNLILKGVFGQFAFSKDLFSVSNITEAFAGNDIKIGMLYSKKTENMLQEGSTWLTDNINAWGQLLEGRKFKYVMLSDEDVETGKHFDLDLLILPGSKAISDQGYTQIKKYVNGGGAIFVTSGLGNYAEGGKWRGWEFFQEVFGVKFSYDLKQERDTEITILHTLRGGNPITANIPTGFTMKIATWDNPIAVEVLEPRTTQVSFWYNFRQDSGLVNYEVKESAGLIYGTYGKGKFVWYGFDIISVLGEQEDYIFFDRMVNNSIMWLTDQPVGFIRDWPGSYQSAAIIIPTVNDTITNISYLLPILQRNKVKASFFVNSDIASENGQLMKQISQVGDVYPVIDIGYLESINDTSHTLNDLTTQESQLSSAKDSLSKITGKEVMGMKPYYGFFNDNTLMAMSKAGYNFLITDSLTDRSVPKMVTKGTDNILIITKTARDDKKIIGDYGLTDTSFQLYTYEEDIDRLAFEGGLYVLKLNSEYQCNPAYVEVVDRIIKYMKMCNMWVTNINDLYNWWISKSKVEMRVESRGKRRVVVALSNVGKDKVDEFIVPIGFTQNISDFELSSEIIGTELPEKQWVAGSKTLILTVRNLKKGESRIYYVDFDIPEES